MSVIAVYKRAPVYAKARQLEPGDKFTWSVPSRQYRGWPLPPKHVAAYGEIEDIGEETEKTDRGVDYPHIVLYGKFFSEATNGWSTVSKYEIPADCDVLILEREIEREFE